MAFVDKVILALVICLAGYSGLSLAEVVSCTAEDFAKCGEITINPSDEMCKSKFQEAKECYTALAESKTCTPNDDQKNILVETMKQVETSLAGCEVVHTSDETTEEPASDGSCTEEETTKCTTMTDNTEVPFCRMAETAVPCFEGALKTCTNADRKKTLEEKLAKLNKDIKEKKCCNEKKLMACDFVEINNETASDENCKKLAEGKVCVSGYLDSCGEEELMNRMNLHMKGADDGLKMCQSKGYSIETDDHDHDHDHKDDGENSANAIQPTLGVMASLAVMHVFRPRLI